MAKELRIKRSLDDLRQALGDQICLLQMSCESYDSGTEAAGKHIALVLRVLLHHHRQSNSLLEQLGVRQLEFHDTAGPIDPAELAEYCGLVVMKMSGEGEYIPRVAAPPNPNHQIRKIPFDQWWDDPVAKTKGGLGGHSFSRRDLVLNVADTDGGAHVDSELESEYMDFSRKNSLGWKFGNGSMEEAFKGRPELVCMRQIAEEVMITLREHCPYIFDDA